MKTNKLIARALVLLGLGATVGLASGCGTSRVSKSRPSESPAAVAQPGDMPVRVMYGVPPVRFDESRPIRERVQ